MQAIILAAGLGSRLRPLTNDIPKVMVEIREQPLIEYTFQRLIEIGVQEVILVVGYKKERLISRYGNIYKGLRIIYVSNDSYSISNNVYSLYLAGRYVKDDVILFEGDVLIKRSPLESIIKEHQECTMMVSPYKKEKMNGTIIKRNQEDVVVQLLDKAKQTTGESYEDWYKTVNITYFKKEFFLQKYYPLLEYYVTYQSVHSYYELVLGGLIYFGNSKVTVKVMKEEEWFEIDDVADYMNACASFFCDAAAVLE